MSAIAGGTRLGPYEIVGAIASGGMGDVYRARDSRLDREVAIKVLPATYSGDPQRLRRFELEARAAGQLAHPNIPAIYDIGTYQGSPYVVSELLDGETLRQRLRGKALPPRRAAELALQIARGLSAVKEMGLVHRDLKPENVFVTRDGRVKILDFGLAKLIQPEPRRWRRGSHRAVEALTQEGLIVGTEGYMSPEQVRGEPVDHRSDIFAFGLILYEMLTGRRAFGRAGPVQTMHAILDEEPADVLELSPGCPPGLARIVRHCMEKNPRERFQSASDIAIALQDTVATLSSGGTAAPASGIVPRRAGATLAWRRPLAITAIAVVAVAAGFALARLTGRAGPLRFTQVTFRRGVLWSARYAPDGQTVVYGAAWDGGPPALYSTKVGVPEARSLNLPGADVLAISRTGEMAVSLRRELRSAWVRTGTLARVPLSGGEPREVVADVEWADWSADGRLAIVRQTEGRDRLEFPVGTPIYATAGWIGHPRVSPRGDLVAFLDHPGWTDDGGSLAVADGGGHVRRLVTGLQSAHGLAWSPSGDEVLFAAADGGAGSAIRAVSLRGRQRVLVQAPAELTLQDVGPDGRVLFTRESWRGEIMALAPGESRVRALSWLDHSLVRDLSADGRTILFTESGRAGGPRSGAYLRRTDGSPAVRLGDGDAAALSPDGAWAITLSSGTPRQLILEPTGPGTPRAVTADAVSHLRVGWFADGSRIAFAGHEPGRGVRLFVQALAGGAPRAITPEGVGVEFAVAPDGTQLAGVDPDRRVCLYSVDGGEARPLPGLEDGMVPVRWSEHGRRLFVLRAGGLPAAVFAYELATGRAVRLHEIEPPDPAGFVRFDGVFVSADGASYAASYLQVLAELFEANGVR